MLLANLMLHPGHGMPTGHLHAEPFAILFMVGLAIVGVSLLTGGGK